MKTKITALLFGLFLASGAYAGNLFDMRSMVLEQALAQNGRCDGEIQKVQRYQHRYLIWYHTGGYIDNELSNGECVSRSGTGETHLAEVIFSDPIPNIVELDWIARLGGLGTTRWIQNPQISTDGILTFHNLEYRENDRNCCPSDRYLNRIRLSDMQVLKRDYLGHVSH